MLSTETKMLCWMSYYFGGKDRMEANADIVYKNNQISNMNTLDSLDEIKEYMHKVDRMYHLEKDVVAEKDDWSANMSAVNMIATDTISVHFTNENAKKRFNSAVKKYKETSDMAKNDVSQSGVSNKLFILKYLEKCDKNGHKTVRCTDGESWVIDKKEKEKFVVAVNKVAKAKSVKFGSYDLLNDNEYLSSETFYVKAEQTFLPLLVKFIFVDSNSHEYTLLVRYEDLSIE